MQLDYRFATPALGALLLLSACGEPSSLEVLNRRAAASMSPDQPCNSAASVQYLPNGARISLPDSALFVVGRSDLSACGQYALSSAVQAMLAQRIMQVIIEPAGDINAPYAGLAREKADRVKGVFSNVGFVSDQPPVLVQPSAGASTGVWGVMLTIAEPVSG